MRCAPRLLLSRCLFAATGCLALAGPAAAAPAFGLDWTPLAAGDLAWLLEDRDTDTLVAEDDGLLVQPLTAWGGWIGDKDAVLGGLALARYTTRIWTGDQVTTVHVGAVRPSLDYRRYLRAREAGQATPWVQAGGYIVAPSARTASDAYTAEEQAAYDVIAASDRARIGGVGARVGLGGEVLLDNGLSVGGRWSAIAHRGRIDETTSFSVSVRLMTEAAVVLGLTF